MMPRTAIPQFAKMIGRELESGAGPSKRALATGPILAGAGATTEIVGRLFVEAHRKRPNDGMIHAYAFMLEGALGTLRVQARAGMWEPTMRSQRCARGSIVPSRTAVSHLTCSCWRRALLRGPSLIRGRRCMRR
jgi:hypothetical protein